MARSSAVPSLLERVVRRWRDAREKIFAYEGIPPLEMWQELADAEHELMKAARNLNHEGKDG